MAEAPARGRLDPAVAAVRREVRRTLHDIEPGRTVLVACSGGADSTALAAATVFESRAAGWQVGAVVVDHGLQTGSADVAEQVAGRLHTAGLDPVEVARARVDGLGGTEAAARAARYRALDEIATRREAACVLLGHTRDDQAETVLLGLARGSGARSLSGMASRSGRYRRPLLQVSREVTARACAAESLSVWQDPHNADPAYSRARVRHRVLPVLEAELGPGVGDALARTAELLRADADALDALAAEAFTDSGAGENALDVHRLAALSPAVRGRVLRLAAVQAGAPANDLFARHVGAVDQLIADWHGQRGVDLPGGVRAWREGSTLRFGDGPVGG